MSCNQVNFFAPYPSVKFPATRALVLDFQTVFLVRNDKQNRTCHLKIKYQPKLFTKFRSFQLVPLTKHLRSTTRKGTSSPRFTISNRTQTCFSALVNPSPNLKYKTFWTSRFSASLLTNFPIQIVVWSLNVPWKTTKLQIPQKCSHIPKDCLHLTNNRSHSLVLNKNN